MNKKKLIQNIADVLRTNNIRKPVASPKKVFHISDDDGNSKDFTLKSAERKVPYTINDVETIVDTCLYVIEESLKRGEAVSIAGFGSLGLRYRKARSTKKFGTDERIDVDARYVPKFSFGNNLRMCAKVYELSLDDLKVDEPLPIFDQTEVES